MKLYLVRHGETQLNVEGVYYGWTDCPLNPHGIEQANTLQQYFKNISYDKVISSDLCRAVTTASIINKEKSVPLIKTKAFREIHFGQWEEKSFSYVQKHYSKEYQQWSNNWQEFMIPGGESYNDFYERVTTELKRIIENDPQNSNLLIVSHNGVISVMLCMLIGVGKGGFWKFNASQDAYSLISINHGNVVIDKINCPV